MKNRMMLKDLKHYLSIVIAIYCLSPFSLFADTYRYNLSDGNMYIWDLSGNYTDHLLGMDVSYDINHDERGILSGSDDITGYDADNDLQIKMTLNVRGFVRQRNGVATVTMFLTGRGTAADDLKEYRLIYSKRITGTISPDLLTIEGNATERVLIIGFNSSNETFDVSIDLPPGVDGSSFLSIEINEDGRRLVGSSTLKLSTNRTFTFDTIGIYNPRKDATRLNLNGNRCRINSEMGNDSSLLSMRGMVLGQSLICSSLIFDTPLAMETIGPSGGTVTQPGGTSLFIPPGALPEDKLISVVTHLDPKTLSAPAPFLGGAKFGPSGTTFMAPVTATFPLNQQYPPGTELSMFTFDSQKGGWSYTNIIATVNSDMVSATAELTHFSDYIIMGGEWKELFGAFEASFFDACNIVPLYDLFDQFKAHVLTRFPLLDRKAYESLQYGYACYEIAGIQLLLNAARSVPHPVSGWVPLDSISRPELVGNAGGYVSLYYINSQVREIAQTVCGEYQMAYTWDIYINLAPRAAEAVIEIDQKNLCIGEKTNVKARLTCGGAPYKNQHVTLHSNIGSIFPDTPLLTDQNGTTPSAIYSADEEGEADIKGLFDACENLISHACQTTIGPETITVEPCHYVELTPSETDLYVDYGRGFTAVLKRADHVEVPGQVFEWKASNARVSIEAISPNTAIIKGLTPGSVRLTASTTVEEDEVVSGTATIEVLPFGLRLEVSPSGTCLVIGESVELSATVLDTDDTPVSDFIYHWSSSDEDVVSVNAITGLAKGVGNGSARITVAATTPGGATLVDFVEIGVSQVTLEPKDFELGVHGGYQLKAILLDREDGTPVMEITPYIIPWDYGRPLGAISIPYEDPNFIPFEEDPDFYPYPSPDVSYKLITWSSSNETVATVNKYGHVHGVSEGQAVISATVLPGSDWEEVGCAAVRVVKKPAINSQMEFDGEARNCYYTLQPGTTPHPFDFRIVWQGSDLNIFTMAWGGGGSGIKVLLPGTNISLIHNPADINLSHPEHQELAFVPGFKILLWAPESMASFTTCGGHRYAAVQHIGWYADDRPIFDWFLFEDYLDAPEGFHLQPICVDDTCALGAVANPEWDPAPTSYWWLNYQWLWD